MELLNYIMCGDACYRSLYIYIKFFFSYQSLKGKTDIKTSGRREVSMVRFVLIQTLTPWLIVTSLDCDQHNDVYKRLFQTYKHKITHCLSWWQIWPSTWVISWHGCSTEVEARILKLKEIWRMHLMVFVAFEEHVHTASKLVLLLQINCCWLHYDVLGWTDFFCCCCFFNQSSVAIFFIFCNDKINK